MMMMAEPEPTPDETWLNSEIEQFAADHQIDLDGATRKADMLEVIEEQTNG